MRLSVSPPPPPPRYQFFLKKCTPFFACMFVNVLDIILKVQNFHLVAQVDFHVTDQDMFEKLLISIYIQVYQSKHWYKYDALWECSCVQVNDFSTVN